MAISRMQQPRQNYGLGSFVKKLTRKVTKPFTKVARKLVPKEIAGIMRIAAPFVGGPAGSLMYLAGTAKQKGRISPMDLALTAAPYAAKTNFGKGITRSIGNIEVPFTKGKDIKELLVGTNVGEFEGPTQVLRPEIDRFGNKLYTGYTQKIPDTTGIIGKGGKMMSIAKDTPGLLDSKIGQLLLGQKDDPTKLSLLKAGSLGLTTADYINTQKQLEKLASGADDVVEETTGGGVTDSEAYQKFLERLALLTPEMFRVPERLRLTAKGGGLMRTNFAMGSDDDPKPLPEDPTKPINPFGPKPIKPLGDMKMADISYSRKEKAQMLADELAEEEFGMDFYDLDIRTQMKIYQIALDMIDEGGGNAMGGLPNDRTNFALGTRPTAQESGLGGLPIEADMRYTGGFMPYGAKEKADDVPARLSKNEFVFTADAVRAAGGGSVQKGAQRMYNTMKQLEAKPEAKGMMA
jgi:hypothetical protein